MLAGECINFAKLFHLEYYTNYFAYRGERIIIKKLTLSIILITSFVALLTGAYLFLSSQFNPSIADAPQSPQTNQNKLDAEVDLKEDKRKITLSAVGDIMVHSAQYNSAYDKDSKSYDFTGNFQVIAPIIRKADLAIANLETVFAGRERGISSYPVFNSPDEMGLALKDSGFDVLSTANNHSLDKGENGVLRTLAFLKEIDLTTVGTYPSREDRDRIVVKDVHGVKIAFISYTYSTNGIPIPKGKEYLVNVINKDKLFADLKKAKELKPDLVIANMHWGNEYQRQPDSNQTDLAKELIADGVDIILGSHPHVIQPIDKIEVSLANGEKREGFVIYSLGNFISNQNMQTLNKKYVDSGVILNFEIEKDFVSNITKITNISYIPTWVHKYNKNGVHYNILPVEEAIQDYEAGNKGNLTSWDYGRLKDVLQETREQFAEIN